MSETGTELEDSIENPFGESFSSENFSHADSGGKAEQAIAKYESSPDWVKPPEGPEAVSVFKINEKNEWIEIIGDREINHTEIIRNSGDAARLTEHNERIEKLLSGQVIEEVRISGKDIGTTLLTEKKVDTTEGTIYASLTILNPDRTIAFTDYEYQPQEEAVLEGADDLEINVLSDRDVEVLDDGGLEKIDANLESFGIALVDIKTESSAQAVQIEMGISTPALEIVLQPIARVESETASQEKQSQIEVALAVAHIEVVRSTVELAQQLELTDFERSVIVSPAIEDQAPKLEQHIDLITPVKAESANLVETAETLNHVGTMAEVEVSPISLVEMGEVEIAADEIIKKTSVPIIVEPILARAVESDTVSTLEEISGPVLTIETPVTPQIENSGILLVSEIPVPVIKFEAAPVISPEEIAVVVDPEIFEPVKLTSEISRPVIQEPAIVEEAERIIAKVISQVEVRQRGVVMETIAPVIETGENIEATTQQTESQPVTEILEVAEQPANQFVETDNSAPVVESIQARLIGEIKSVTPVERQVVRETNVRVERVTERVVDRPGRSIDTRQQIIFEAGQTSTGRVVLFRTRETEAPARPTEQIVTNIREVNLIEQRSNSSILSQPRPASVTADEEIAGFSQFEPLTQQALAA